ncbi:MAG: hypothetical protein D8M57_13735 [Candidatus Scalindua sp. AMX11]|nr:MAG: hypothetical protein DWQ00_06245 [Candidatus Scalindua sp.]NOG83414.1 hypothetical protein [Planctomycetota bacterium]RZV75073.1 MAG: hypothetical protein EX341_12765 [Candidatus Scalindua sp. SCAELEC01]TDE64335.1 MAG: hypothetical protein D8M57_13735 [Candidatus Scalindua sp. AMX11]GJQ60606.1 MAG: hypothetical protein SCALA701_34070 [Candidatus Scalindua sp.]
MDWHVNKGAKNCSCCQKLFEEEEEYFSALYDNAVAYTRKDLCLNCWDMKHDGDLFSYWKTKVQKKSEPVRQYANIEVFYDLFVRSESEDNASNKNFRYVLALYLMRKKVLTLKAINRENGDEFLVLQNSKEEKETRVLNPKLNQEGILAVKEEIGNLIGCSTQNGSQEAVKGGASAVASNGEKGH